MYERYFEGELAPDLLRALEFLSIKQRIIMNTIISIYKIVNSLWPRYLSEKIKFKSDNPRKVGLRCNRDNLIEPIVARKAYSQNSIFHNGIKLYNKIPLEIRECDSVAKFKS